MTTRLLAFKKPASVAVAVAGSFAAAVAVAGSAYDLSRTEGMNCFGGSAEAEKLLATQGFVVAAPCFVQIFQPYIESPLPVFVTPDSAWHAYHVLLEEGVKEMERAQSLKLAEFSRLLLRAAKAQATNGSPEFSAIADYASLGLALQDQGHRETLAAGQKRWLESLLTGTAPLDSPIGFPLSPVQFRPQSFYLESPELKDFYAARQWYACVDFRLSNERETTLALCLAWVVESNPELLAIWKQLSEPYDSFVAQPEDGTVTSYNRTAKAILGAQFGPAGFMAHLGDIQKRLAANLPAPRINDQSLSPAEYAQFARSTKGFRLLPGRQLPCAVCFQNTVDPKIPGRMVPSGLDFFAASPVMRSAAAQRALEGQFGKTVAQAVAKADCPPMPDSLYGRSMELLAKLQEPLPARVPPPLRTEAWADLQLLTQLGAWSEQRHTWALYAKNPAYYGGDVESPPGIVAPYPVFFAGLAKLSRETATAFEKTAVEQRFDAKAIAAELFELERLVHNNYDGMSEQELARIRPKTQHFSRFTTQFYARHQSELTNAWKLHGDLDEMLKRVAATGTASPAETETLRLYYDTRQVSTPALNGFAGLCDRLAELARKQLAGTSLDREDANWVRDYGKTLAAYHGYGGNSWLCPLDDFSLVTRIFDNPLVGSVLYAGVVRPQALYVILPYKGKFQLYRGAVLSYREFVRPESESLDDNSWREMVKQGKAPPPPPFTQSFLRADTPNAAEKEKARAAEPPVKPAPPARIKLAVNEVDLGPKPTQWVRHEGWITPSEDCRHVAYRVQTGSKWKIVREGVPGKEYDQAHYQEFSPNGEHLAYLARKADKWCVVLDGVEGPPFLRINETTKHYWPFVFSQDSAHLAYVATIEKGKQCVVVDGVQGPVFDEVLHHSLSFSENSKHFVYAARRGGQGIVVKDGKEALRAEDVLTQVHVFGDTRIGDTFGPFLSPDGERLACAIRRGTNWFILLDGAESRPWDDIQCLVAPGEQMAGFSPDGRHFTYVGMRAGKNFVVVDQKDDAEGWMSCAVFSADGKHSAFVRARDKQGQGLTSSVVLDGKAGKDFPGEINDLVFSPDGKRLAYKVKERPASDYFAVHDGEVFEDYYAAGDVIFSPDSRHMAFRGNKFGKAFVVVDGQEYLKSEEADQEGLRSGYFTFSPDSKRWAYIAQHKGKKYAAVSGVEYGPYDYLSVPDEEAYVYFSPDSRHFAFMAMRDSSPTNYWGRQYLVVDGLEHEIEGAWLCEGLLRFDSPTKLHGLVMGKERIIRLEAEIVEK